MHRTILFISTILMLVPAISAQAQTLRGSTASVERQNRLAVGYGYTFVETAQAMTRLIDAGQLIRISPNRHMELHDVSFPYARSGVKLLVNRLSEQYYGACGEKLTITSLSRPINQQPANAAARSVHPAGMAVDLRVPRTRRCRSWLESTLLYLEGEELLDVTRERNPPHYHVAVFVEDYERYVANLTGSTRQYVVRRGDTLSEISRLAGVSVEALKSTNGLSSDLINIGQELVIPEARRTSGSAGNIAAISRVTHTVRKGETLWRIGNQYGASVSQIRTENDLDDDLLQIGQELHITSSR